MKLPDITLGHTLWVIMWGILGVAVGAVAWSQGRSPTYKDFLAGTLGISFEALGVELTRGKQALIVPLSIGLMLALGVRFLPDTVSTLKVYKLQGRSVASLLFILYFFVSVMVLLLSYRGWWDVLFVSPAN